MKCLHLNCEEVPVARVAGGTPAKTWIGLHSRLGWAGLYCRTHILSCVEAQLFQVEAGLPIIIEQVRW